MSDADLIREALNFAHVWLGVKFDRDNHRAMDALARMEAVNTASFDVGYERGKIDAIDRCLMERVSKDEPDWRSHNTALGLAVIAIRALDVRHAKPATGEPE